MVEWKRTRSLDCEFKATNWAAAAAAGKKKSSELYKALNYHLSEFPYT